MGARRVFVLLTPTEFTLSPLSKSDRTQGLITEPSAMIGGSATGG